MIEIRHYLTIEGQDLFAVWLRQLRDPIAKIQIVKRINRVEIGNYGDHKYCRDGVWELRIDVGAGYRVYYAQAGLKVVLLLCAGAKRTQAADIDRAARYWTNWQRRSCDEG